jgi:hypothetical protein
VVRSCRRAFLGGRSGQLPAEVRCCSTARASRARTLVGAAGQPPKCRTEALLLRQSATCAGARGKKGSPKAKRHHRAPLQQSHHKFSRPAGGPTSLSQPRSTFGDHRQL